MNIASRWLDAYAAYVTRRPAVVLALLLVLGLVAGGFAVGLKFESSYAALLPDSSPELDEIAIIKDKGISTTELLIILTGPEEERLAFARRTSEALRASDWVERADIEFGASFFEERKLLLLPTDKLAQMEVALKKSVRKVKQRANPLFVPLDDLDPWEDLKAFEDELGGDSTRSLRDHLISKDGRSLYMVVQPGAATSEVGDSKQALSAIKALVEGQEPGAAGIEVSYAGRLMVLIEEEQLLQRDMMVATLVALVLVVLMLTVWTRRVSTLVVIGGPLFLGILVTLAVTRLAVGQLNLVSGFMIPALVGLGVDFCIHLYLRFLEGIEGGELSRPMAMQVAINETFGACLVSALTTVGAFFALVSSDFKGVSEYGLVAGLGVIVTLFVAFLALPPLGVLVIRARKGASAARLAPRPLSRRLALALVVVMGAVGAFAATTVDQVSFQNDFRQLRGDSKSEAYYDTITAELGGPLDPALIMVGDLSEARRAEALLRDAAAAQSGDGAYCFGRILSLATLVPDEDSFRERLAILAQMREALEGLPARRLSDEDKTRLDDLIKLTRAAPWTVAEIPEPLRNRMRLVSDDGEHFFVLVWSKHQLYRDEDVIRWADNLDALLIEIKGEGIEAWTLDEIRVTARMLKILQRDFPDILAYACLSVLLILIVYFRSARKVLLVGGSLVVGVLFMLGAMATFDIDLNLFNVVVIPTVVGIGIDNAIHIQHGYDLQGPGSIPLVMATRGRAALMASMTTAIGFGVMILAHHYGVYTLGALALVGVGCTFAATTILLPAVLSLLEKQGG